MNMFRLVVALLFLAYGLIIGVLNNGLNMLNVASFWQYVAKGVVILLAVMVDVLRKQSKDKRKALPKKAAKA